MKKSYKERLRVPIEGGKQTFYTTSKTPVAKGYLRVVIGDRGPYIEFSQEQILHENITIPEDQRYRLNDKRVYYVEYRTKDDSKVKVYHQKRTVKYADYKIGLWYISPFELSTDDEKELVEPLNKTKPSLFD